MIRLLGSLTGTALAIALLLLVVGIPQFRAPESGIERTVMTLPLQARPVEPVESIESGIETEAHAMANAGPDIVAAREADVPDENSPARLPIVESLPPTTANVASNVAPSLTAMPEHPGEPRWHTFWSPFRSEIAANGFVERLQSVTGLDYRIQRVKAGVYEVSFAYVDDSDIPGSLSLITAATGLDFRDR